MLKNFFMSLSMTMWQMFYDIVTCNQCRKMCVSSSHTLSQNALFFVTDIVAKCFMTLSHVVNVTKCVSSSLTQSQNALFFCHWHSGKTFYDIVTCSQCHKMCVTSLMILGQNILWHRHLYLMSQNVLIFVTETVTKRFMTLSLAVNIIQIVFVYITDNMAKCFLTLSHVIIVIKLCVFITDTVAKRFTTLSKAVHDTKCIVVFVTDTMTKCFSTLSTVDKITKLVCLHQWHCDKMFYDIATSSRHCLCHLPRCQMSSSICPWQTFPASSNIYK
jgi:hypothetical protein